MVRLAVNKSVWLVMLGFLIAGCSKAAKSSSTSQNGKNTESGKNTVINAGALQLPDGSKLNASDVPTITYDAISDVTKVAAGTTVFGPLTLNVPLNLSGPSDLGIVSSEGGSAKVTGLVNAGERTSGTVVLNDLRARKGFPSLNASDVRLEFSKSPTAIKGTVKSKGLQIGESETKIELDANYDLFFEDGLWRGKMTGTMILGELINSFSYDYDAPILSKLEVVALDENGNEINGPRVGPGKVRLKAQINSNAPVNWVNLSLDTPSGNLEGGGSGKFYTKVPSCIAQPFQQTDDTVCEHSLGFWTWYRDFTISQYQPAGKWSWQVSVKNAAELKSEEIKASIIVEDTGSTAQKPVVESIVLESSESLLVGGGGEVTLHVLAKSEIPVTWLNLSLDGPTSNVEGGGSGVTFSQCSSFQSNAPSICAGKSTGYWYYNRSWSFTSWSENGTYTFANISVQSEANITSEQYQGSPTFSIAGNQIATTPTYIAGKIYKVQSWGQNPLTGEEITSGCLTSGSQPDPLMVAVVLDVQSSAPISWLTVSFDGPTSNLEGGGSGPDYIESLGGDNWRVVSYNPIAAPGFAPKGLYSYSGLKVKNDGNKESAAYSSPLQFQLQVACP
jgi:hypothetical protein